VKIADLEDNMDIRRLNVLTEGDMVCLNKHLKAWRYLTEEEGNMGWNVYLVKCADNSLYCGITNDITSRIAKHNAGKGAKYTQSRLPVELMAASR
jgi:hypothetical protein